MSKPGSAGRPKVLVTRTLPQAVEARLDRLFDVHRNPADAPMQAEALAAAARGMDGMIITPADQANAAMMAGLPDSLRIIACFSVGFDHVDLAAAKARGITVTNTPDVLTDATADIAMLLILGAARGAHWGSRMIAENTWDSWSPVKPLGLDVGGKRLGIYGMGRIGQATARRARAHGMEIHYTSRKPVAAEQALGAVYHASLHELLPHCDFLSIHCASTPETRGSIGAAELALLPSPAVLVNTARGDIIDEQALLSALTESRLAAAGLDVFRNEPRIDPRFRALPNAFLLPHLGSATPGTRQAMGMKAVDNLEAFFSGRVPPDRL